MTQREYQLATNAGAHTLGQKIGFIGKLIRSAKYKGAYARPAQERATTLHRLRALVRKLNLRMQCQE